MGAAAPVRDAAVKRLDRQAARGVAGDARREAPSEAVQLDDVTYLDTFKPHRIQA